MPGIEGRLSQLWTGLTTPQEHLIGGRLRIRLLLQAATSCGLMTNFMSLGKLAKIRDSKSGSPGKTSC